MYVGTYSAVLLRVVYRISRNMSCCIANKCWRAIIYGKSKYGALAR